MPKPTPGPWHVEDGCLIYAPEGTLNFDGTTLGPLAICYFPDHDANARLMAAAPELLEFARYVADTDPGNPAPFFAKAREAIAKAVSS